MEPTFLGGWGGGGGGGGGPAGRSPFITYRAVVQIVTGPNPGEYIIFFSFFSPLLLLGDITGA